MITAVEQPTLVENNSNANNHRLDITGGFHHVFKGLPDAVENNLHRASRTGNCVWIRNILDGHAELYPKSIGASKPKLGSPIDCINERNHLGASPLWLAAIAGHDDVVKLLIEYGADLESQDIKGQTPLHAAVKFNCCTTVEILLKAGADPDGSDTSTMTPIYVTARDNFPHAMALLIQYGADVNGRHGKMTSGETTKDDCTGNLPVYMAVVYRHSECFKQLVLGGADLCLPLALKSNNGASLLRGILRYSCEIRYVKLLYFCGGIKELDEIDDVITIYRNRNDTLTDQRKRCLDYLEQIKKFPMSLSALARIAIRKTLGPKRLHLSRSLSLPAMLKEYLNMSLLEV